MSFATLLWELLLTRVYSATIYYHFAFMAVCVGMFGLALGGIVVFLWPPRHPAFLMEGFGVATAITVVLCMAFMLNFQLWGSPLMVSPPPLYLLLQFGCAAIPFTLMGAFITLGLTRWGPGGRVMAANLAGAALAAAAMPLFVSAFRGPGTVFAIGFLAQCASASMALGRRGRLMLLGALVMVVGALLNDHEQWLRVYYRSSSDPPAVRWERWNEFSRVTVEPESLQPAGPGIDPKIGRFFSPVRQMKVEIDQSATAPILHFNGNVKSLTPLKYDISSFAYHLREDHSKVCIIGAGGGRDILTALAFNSHWIKAIEINPNVVAAFDDDFAEFAGRLGKHTGVTIIVDDARNCLTGTRQTFDIIQGSFVDTAAATTAGAYAFTENGLYTVEGWRIFLDHLRPHGFFTMTRYFAGATIYAAETYRLVALAVRTLNEMGIANPARCILVAVGSPLNSGDRLATIVVSPCGFTPQDLARAHLACREMNLDLAMSPDVPVDVSFRPLLMGSDDVLRDTYPLDVTPPTDDRPYFFFFAPLRFAMANQNIEGDSFNLMAVRVLYTLGLMAAGLAFILITTPVAIFYRRGTYLHIGGWARPFYFFVIGCAYICVEIALLQRMSLYLGDPGYAFATVPASILAFSAVGSFLSDATNRRSRAFCALLLLTGAALIAGTPWYLSTLLSATAGSSLSVRYAIVASIIAPLAMFMGCGMPFGLAASLRTEGAAALQRTAWYCSVNASACVIGSVGAMLCCIELGSSATLLIGAALYALSAFILVIEPACTPDEFYKGDF